MVDGRLSFTFIATICNHKYISLHVYMEIISSFFNESTSLHFEIFIIISCIVINYFVHNILYFLLMCPSYIANMLHLTQKYFDITISVNTFLPVLISFSPSFTHLPISHIHMYIIRPLGHLEWRQPKILFIKFHMKRLQTQQHIIQLCIYMRLQVFSFQFLEKAFSLRSGSKNSTVNINESLITCNEANEPTNQRQ